MICPFCGKEIPDDCYFCDQCGKALSYCPECRAPKRGTACPICGEDLITAEEYFALEIEQPISDAVADEKTLYLSGMGLKLKIKEGVFGSKGGIYPEFGNLRYVSRQHGEFQYDDVWYLMDLGSTNGTRINGEDLDPKTLYVIEEGDRITIAKHNHFTVTCD